MDLVDETSITSILVPEHINYYINCAVRLTSANDPSIDHTEKIISFSDVGPGVGAYWYCITSNPGGVVWQFPNGDDLPIGNSMGANTAAVGDELFISGLTTPEIAVALHRGPTHFSPDGDHCCVRIATNERRCVTFTPCPALSPLTDINGRISYDPDTNTATYRCVTGYTPTITSGTALQITCMSDDASVGTWSPPPPAVTCARVSCGNPPSVTNVSPGKPSNTLYQGAVTYTCDTGYWISQGSFSGFASCRADRTWGPIYTNLSTCGLWLPPYHHWQWISWNAYLHNLPRDSDLHLCQWV